MTASDACLRIIADSEGFRSHPYLCPAGIPTIGYGCTYYADGRKVTLKDQPISQPDAWNLLGRLAGKVADQVTKASKVTLTQGQLDALTSFAYNAGIGALTASTLWRKLQAGDVAGAAAEFPKWIRGGGKVLPGLVTRRAAEQKLFAGAAT